MTKEKFRKRFNGLKQKESENNEVKTLLDLEVGESATLLHIGGDTKLKRRLFDLGFIRGTRITALYNSPFNDPIAYLVRGGVIALRSEDSENIIIG